MNVSIYRNIFDDDVQELWKIVFEISRKLQWCDLEFIGNYQFVDNGFNNELRVDFLIFLRSINDELAYKPDYHLVHPSFILGFSFSVNYCLSIVEDDFNNLLWFFEGNLDFGRKLDKE